MDSMLIALILTKKNAEMSVKDIREMALVEETYSQLLGSKEEFEKIVINDTIIKAVQAKRKTTWCLKILISIKDYLLGCKTVV